MNRKLLLLTGFCVAAVSAHAGTTNFTWVGSQDGTWANGANWFVDVPTFQPNPEPNGPSVTLRSIGTNDNVIFRSDLANGMFSIDVGRNLRQVNGMTFDSGSGGSGFILNALGLNPGVSKFGINVGPGGIVNNDSFSQFINVPINLTSSKGNIILDGSTVTFSAANGGLNFADTWVNAAAGVPLINLNGGVLGISGAHDVSIGTSTTPGVIAGSGSILKTGTGSLFIQGTGSNSMTGGAVINGGSVVVYKNNALGTGPVQVNNGGTLAGYGSVGGPVTVNFAGRITGGASGPGTLILDSSLNLKFGSRVLVQMNSANGVAGASTGWSFISAATISLENVGPGSILVDLTSLTLGNSAGQVSDFDPTRVYNWIFAQAGSITGFSAGLFTVDTQDFGNAFDGTFGVDVENGGTTLNLTYQPVPEPSTVAMGLLGGFAFLSYFLFRRNRE